MKLTLDIFITVSIVFELKMTSRVLVEWNDRLCYFDWLTEGDQFHFRLTATPLIIHK